MIYKALRCKWNWRFAVENNSLKKMVIILKYGVEGRWFTRDGKGNYVVGLWKDIRKETGWLAEHSVFAIGDGIRVCFWEDMWCGIAPVFATYPFCIQLLLLRRGLWQIAVSRTRELGTGILGFQGFSGAAQVCIIFFYHPKKESVPRRKG